MSAIFFTTVYFKLITGRLSLCFTQRNFPTHIPNCLPHYHKVNLKNKYFINPSYIIESFFFICDIQRTAQSIQQLTTCCAVRGSNPGGGEIFRTHPDWPWGPPSLLYNGYWVFSWGKAGGVWC
jgi:hypothetical protein